MRNPHGLAAARTHDHDIRSLDRTLALRDAASYLLSRVWTCVPLDHHHVLHQNLAGLVVHAENAAGLATVPAGDHLHGVFLLEIDTYIFGCQCHQITSGASDTIFMNFLSRS